MELYDIIYEQADKEARQQISDVLFNLKSSLTSAANGRHSIEIPLTTDTKIITVEPYKAFLHIDQFADFVSEKILSEMREEIRQDLIKTTANFLSQLQKESEQITINWTATNNPIA